METLLPKKDLWHLEPFDLKVIPSEQYANVLSVCFNDPQYKQLMDVRVAAVNLITNTDLSKQNPKRARTICQQMAQRVMSSDTALATYLMKSLVQYQLSQKATTVRTFEQFEKHYSSISPEHAEKVKHITQLRTQIAFMCDALSSSITDLNDALKDIDPNSSFDSAKGMQQSLNMLHAYVSDINSVRTTDEIELFGNTCDSIKQYLDKRIDTYYNRIADMRNKAFRAAQRERQRKEKAAIKESINTFAKKDRDNVQKQVERKNYRIAADMVKYKQDCIDDLYFAFTHDVIQGTWKTNLQNMMFKELGEEYCNDETSVRQWLEAFVEQNIMNQSKAFTAMILELESKLAQLPKEDVNNEHLSETA